MPLERDSRLGKFVIRQAIGSGGMGVVYRAVDTVLGRTVAIKTLHADKAGDRQALARFKREALAVSAINHDNIVKVIDFVEDEVPYLVMEYLEGQNLDARIRRAGPMGYQAAVDIMLEVCDAVSKCHRQGYVHRDLKSTNIFLADCDGVEVTKVLDFGVAKVWGETGSAAGDAANAELTRQGMVVGTPRYLAPEILNGQPATPKSDQYSLGIVLYYALTGRQPFVSQRRDDFRDHDLFQLIIKGEHAPIRVHQPDLPEGLEHVVEAAINRDPLLRFGSVHMMGGALTPWATQRGRDRWSDHFSKAPRPVAAHLSAPIRADEREQSPSAAKTARDSQLATVQAQVRTQTDPQVPGAPPAESARKERPQAKASAHSLTLVDPAPAGVGVSIPAARAPHPSTASRPADPGSLESVDVSLSAISEIAAPAPRRSGRWPLVSVGVAAAVLAVAGVAVFRQTTPSTHGFPRAATATTTTTPSGATTSPIPVAPPSPTSAPTPVSVADTPKPTASKADTAARTEKEPAVERAPRRHRHRQRRIELDPNGVAIPSAD